MACEPRRPVCACWPDRAGRPAIEGPLTSRAPHRGHPGGPCRVSPGRPPYIPRRAHAARRHPPLVAIRPTASWSEPIFDRSASNSRGSAQTGVTSTEWKGTLPLLPELAPRGAEAVDLYLQLEHGEELRSIAFEGRVRL